jgi:hypothetical protein
VSSAPLARDTRSRFSPKTARCAVAPTAALLSGPGAGEWPPLRSRPCAVFPFGCAKHLRSSRAQGIPTRLAAGFWVLGPRESRLDRLQAHENRKPQILRTFSGSDPMIDDYWVFSRQLCWRRIPRRSRGPAAEPRGRCQAALLHLGDGRCPQLAGGSASAVERKAYVSQYGSVLPLGRNYLHTSQDQGSGVRQPCGVDKFSNAFSDEPILTPDEARVCPATQWSSAPPLWPRPANQHPNSDETPGQSRRFAHTVSTGQLTSNDPTCL